MTVPHLWYMSHVAGSSDKARGRPFQPGVSGNPSGLPKATREIRRKVSAALDEAFTKDGRDLLVDAIVAGVQTGDSTCLKLASEYRWGKPATEVELTGPGGEPLAPKVDYSRLSNDELTQVIRLTEKAKVHNEGEQG